MKDRPSEAYIKGISQEHLAGGLGLRFALGGEDGVVGAPLDAPFLVPCALSMPHEHNSLRLSQRRQRLPELWSPKDFPDARAKDSMWEPCPPPETIAAGGRRRHQSEHFERRQWMVEKGRTA